jgi:hypothetical protein
MTPLTSLSAQAWNIGKVCFEADTEPYSKARDKNMVEGIEAAGVPWHSFVSHTLYVSTLTRLAHHQFHLVLSITVLQDAHIYHAVVAV